MVALWPAHMRCLIIIIINYKNKAPGTRMGVRFDFGEVVVRQVDYCVNVS